MSVLDFLRPKQAIADVPERIEPVIAEPVVAAADTPTPLVPFQQIHWPASGAGSRVKSLPPVSPVIAQKHATVYTCCNVISGDLAKVPLDVWQRDSEGKESRVRQHDAVYLLNVESSPKVAAITMRFALNYAFTLRGTAYGYSPRDGGGALKNHLQFAGHVGGEIGPLLFQISAQRRHQKFATDHHHRHRRPHVGGELGNRG